MPIAINVVFHLAKDTMKQIITLLLSLIIVGCGIIQNRDVKNVTEYYSNGEIFFEGQHVTINGEISYPDGEWKIFYPDGKLKEEITYFESYSIPGITTKYDTNGILLSRKEIKDYNNYFYEEYYNDGTVKLSKYYEHEFLKEDGINFIDTLEDIVEYYPNGNKKSEYRLLSGMYYEKYYEYNQYGDTIVNCEFID
ncbi:MAG: hypothetical protein WC069_06840 [Candidatus Shapirobacteria bacterium]